MEVECDEDYGRYDEHEEEYEKGFVEKWTWFVVVSSLVDYYIEVGVCCTR